MAPEPIPGLEQRIDDVPSRCRLIGVCCAAGNLGRIGEILVSRTVKDLVAGAGIECSDRGTTALKGVPGEWRLYLAHA